MDETRGRLAGGVATTSAPPLAHQSPPRRRVWWPRHLLRDQSDLAPAALRTARAPRRRAGDRDRSRALVGAARGVRHGTPPAHAAGLHTLRRAPTGTRHRQDGRQPAQARTSGRRRLRATTVRHAHGPCHRASQARAPCPVERQARPARCSPRAAPVAAIQPRAGITCFCTIAAGGSVFAGAACARV